MPFVSFVSSFASSGVAFFFVFFRCHARRSASTQCHTTRPDSVCATFLHLSVWLFRVLILVRTCQCKWVSTDCRGETGCDDVIDVVSRVCRRSCTTSDVDNLLHVTSTISLTVCSPLGHKEIMNPPCTCAPQVRTIQCSACAHVFKVTHHGPCDVHVRLYAISSKHCPRCYGVNT